MKIKVDHLRKIIREEVQRKLSEGFGDYIRDVDRNMPSSWGATDPQDVHDMYLMLRGENDSVPLDQLARHLGVDAKDIDWNGTGLRVLNGIVSELI